MFKGVTYYEEKRMVRTGEGLLFQGLSASFLRNPGTYCSEIVLAIRHLATLNNYNQFCRLLFNQILLCLFFFIYNEFQKKICNSFHFIVLQQYIKFNAMLASVL